MATQPFAYGMTSDPTNHIYPLFPGNAAPALVVWLFLVTDPYFLQEASRVKQRARTRFNADILPIDQIAKFTNLKPQAVQSILDVFMNATLARQESFNDVAQAFQDFAQQHNGGWQPGECPHDAMPMLWLAIRGAAVDPTAQTLPPLPDTVESHSDRND